ncbi:MAG: HEPN domain-containing protein [Candidatus Latescibacterota bacterium]
MRNQAETSRLWLIKAEHDLKIGMDEFATDHPTTDAICFHMQQCVEKYLKGYLVFFRKEIERTHNIGRILRECMDLDPSFSEIDTPAVNRLTLYATELRHPDDFYIPSLDETREAIQQAEMVKAFVHEKLRIAGFEFQESGKE